MTALLRARSDPALSARLLEPRPLMFASADPARDLPGHVRAGSAVRRWGERLVIVQDDVHALALLDEASGAVASLALPRGADGRRMFGDGTGNKALKMDLEACVVLADGRLVALGSGSRPERERVVVVEPSGEVRVVQPPRPSPAPELAGGGPAGGLDPRDLYGRLRARVDFAGTELNIEGAVVVAGALRVFQRGNGARRGGLEPVDAVGDLDLADFVAWLDGARAPELTRVMQVELGSVVDVRFGFTDATALPDGRVAFLAAAEASVDAYHDGEVVGSRFGVMDGDDVVITDIIDDATGARSRLKLEGIDWLGERSDGTWELVVVADLDAPDVPAVIATLHVTRRDPGGHT